MGFVKVIKNKAYFKRFQVKFKRRRECKTDYYARQRLILQDKNKYMTPKYRFVVRFTNSDIICQVFSSDLDHDVCIASAYSHELKRYGVKVGLTNFSAAYCTGLLLARRVIAKFKLDDYEGVVRAECDMDSWDENYLDGIFDIDDEDNEKGAFTALLDVGLARTTTGSRLFGALKGAVDGGLNIPHSNKRMPRWKKDDDGEDVEDPEMERNYIFGQHVADYMKKLQEEGKDEDYKRQFGRYVKEGVGADDLEKMYTACHAAIRADPHKGLKSKEEKTKAAYKGKSFKVPKQNREDRADKVRKALLEMGKKSVSAMDWKEEAAAAEDDAPAEDAGAGAEAEEDDEDLDDML